MRQQKLSSPVQGRVINFFDYLWLRNKGTDPHTLLADMPYCMQSEVSLATTESLIKEVHTYYTTWQVSTIGHVTQLFYGIFVLMCYDQVLFKI